ncbi:MAG: hypothetical protein WD824_21065 [Cyclobacteriaceae bacterium]
MKNLFSLFALGLILFSCQTAPKQYFANSPEIEMIKKANAAYVSGDWNAMRSVYADTAKIYHNTWDAEVALNVDDFIKGMQTTAANYNTYKLSDDAVYEMIVTDEGQKWVHNWFLWSGTHKNGVEVKIPVNISFLIVDNKVAMQVNMFNALPGYLAENPASIVSAETEK